MIVVCIGLVAGSLISAGISAAGSIGGSAINAGAQSNLNYRTRKWNEMFYGQQLADQRESWRMQNEYNSPTAQMQRLKDAGLNPHLVYGKGADAQGASMGSPPSPAPWRPENPRYGDMVSNLGSSISGYLDLQQKQANIDYTKSQTRSTEAKAFEQEFNNSLLDGNWATAIRRAKSYALGQAEQNIIGKSLENQLKSEMQGLGDFKLSVIDDLSSAIAGSVREISYGPRGTSLPVAKVKKELQYMSSQIEGIVKSNDLKVQQKEMNRLEIEFNRKLGLPANSPWYAIFVARLLKQMLNISFID